MDELICYLVYDFGGGMFDVMVMEVVGNDY